MPNQDEPKSNVRVYEQKESKGIPLWVWVGALMLLVGLGLYWANRPHEGIVETTKTDSLKPDNSATPTEASRSRTATTWTTGTIADAFRRTGRFALGDAEVHFATASAKLEGDSQAVLDDVATVLKENADWKFKVLGHTDSTGTAAVNEKLAMERAESVVAYLNARGVSPGRLTPVKEYGERAPKADNASDVGRAENRRVELIKD